MKASVRRKVGRLCFLTSFAKKARTTQLDLKILANSVLDGQASAGSCDGDLFDRKQKKFLCMHLEAHKADTQLLTDTE